MSGFMVFPLVAHRVAHCSTRLPDCGLQHRFALAQHPATQHAIPAVGGEVIPVGDGRLAELGLDGVRDAERDALVLAFELGEGLALHHAPARATSRRIAACTKTLFARPARTWHTIVRCTPASRATSSCVMPSARSVALVSRLVYRVRGDRVFTVSGFYARRVSHVKRRNRRTAHTGRASHVAVAGNRGAN